MSSTTVDTDYDLTINVNLTLSVSNEDIEALKELLSSGDLDADSIEQYLTELVVNDVENQDDINVWIPETDGTIRAWITGSWADQNATELHD